MNTICDPGEFDPVISTRCPKVRHSGPGRLAHEGSRGGLGPKNDGVTPTRPSISSLHAVETAVLNRFRYMRAAYPAFSCQIRDRARYFQDTVVAAS